MATTNIQLDQQQPHQNNFTFLPMANMRNSNIFDENLLINNNHNHNENSNNCNGNSSIIDYSNNDFNNGNTLNTPDIVDMLDSFHPTFQSEKYYNNDQNPLLFTDVYSQLDAQQSPLMLLEPTTTQTSAIMMNPASNQSMINQSMINDNYNNYQKQHNYYDQHQQQIKPEPYSLLESSEINLEYMNSPEMAPVSPNKVCPQSEYEYSQQPSPLSSNNNSTISYQNLECAQPILQIKNEFDIMFDDYLNDQQSKQQSQLNKNQINDSPSYSISSNYSSIDSSSSSAAPPPQSKTFTLIDVVKQESFDSSTTGLLMPRQQPQQQQQQQSTIVPTVVDETTASFIPQNDRQQQQQQQIIYNLTPLNNLQQQNTVTPTTNYYYMTSSNNNNNTNNDLNQAHITALQSVSSSSSSSSSINHSNHSQQQQQPPITNGRKRAATMNNNNNGSNNHNQQTTAIKKPRMSKREKQKLMESYIDQYERENKQLIEQIELFEKQINFCKKYLNESVAPYIQQQQQNQQPIHQQIQNIIGMV